MRLAATLRGLALLALLAGTSSCGSPELAPLDTLLLPTGLALSPDAQRLFVTNGNWDGERSASSLVVVDLAALELGLAQPGEAGAELDASRPCRAHGLDPRIECAPTSLIDPETSVRLPAGAGNIALDRPAGDAGPLRLLIPTRLEPTLSWVDVLGEGYGDTGPLRLDCGQAEDRLCDSLHRLTLDQDPSRVSVDNQGFRFAYLPHLLGRRLTLFSLDGDFGPEITDIEREFFREDQLFDSGLGGGFAVVQRMCDVATGNAPANTLDCVRPYLLASHRYWEGVRGFRVAPGLSIVVAGGDVAVVGPNLEAADPKPLMGGMAFEDPEQGDRLLVVHTTPPALSRVDMSLDENDNPRIDVVATVNLCTNPNLVVVHRPALDGQSGPELAFVSCYGSDQVAVVDLNVFAVVKTIDVGDGPNELLIDRAHGWLFVANTAESSISLIELEVGEGYLEEIATLGLATPARAGL